MYILYSATLYSPSDDVHLMIQQARALAEASRSLMQDIKYAAADTWPGREAADRGVVMVKELALATTDMAKAAKTLASCCGSKETEKGVSTFC